MPSFSFKKAERLKSRKTIQTLFKVGNSYAVYPLRLVWLPIEKVVDIPVLFSLSVAKKRMPKAAHRNRIRRRIREAWRLNKDQLYLELQQQENSFAFMIIYSGQGEMPYATIEKSMQTIIERFPKKMRANQKAQG